MLINEIESIVRISKKTIRYYEEQGLLNPKRNKENDYRIYCEKDIEKLKLIKFLRDLNVPINDIKKLDNKEITIKEIMEDRIKKIEEEEYNFKLSKEMCKEIKNAKKININKYSEQMNILNKKGFTMKEIEKNHKQKILGAVISSLVASLFFIFFIVLFTYIQFFEAERMPWIVYGVFIIIFATPQYAIIYNLISRIKEIKGGEEDEASKY